MLYGPHDWLHGMAPELFDCYVRMLPRLEAERRLAGATEVAVGTGSTKEGGRIAHAWERASSPRRRRRQLSREEADRQLQLQSALMASQGITVVVEDQDGNPISLDAIRERKARQGEA